MNEGEIEAEHQRTSLGDADVWVSQHKFAERGVQSEAVHSTAPGHHQHGSRGVQRIRGRNLLRPPLQSVGGVAACFA